MNLVSQTETLHHHNPTADLLVVVKHADGTYGDYRVVLTNRPIGEIAADVVYDMVDYRDTMISLADYKPGMPYIGLYYRGQLLPRTCNVAE